MKMLNKKIQLNLIVVISIITLIVIIILFVIFLKTDYNQAHLNSILGGLCTGGVIALLQLYLSHYEHKEINRFKQMRVIDIKADRDDRPFYAKLIREAKSNIEIMGVTASRFMEHFADIRGNREESKLLIRAMERGVNVKILVPNQEYLEDEKQKDTYKHTKEVFNRLSSEFANKFQYKYFNHAPAHSIFIIDNICILGPVFPGISSKDTPAIQIEKDSPYASRYIDYFNAEWDKN